MITFQVPKITTNLGKELYFVKLPNFLSVDCKPFDPETYEDEIEDEENPIYEALAPRVGDINLDGYPDILLRMHNPVSLKHESHLLLNVPVNQENVPDVSGLQRLLLAFRAL